MRLIKSDVEKGKRFINKSAIGERQLAAAIRMYFLELDPLAIHTVSSAAHNVLADLLQERGQDPTVYGLVYGLLRAAKDLHTGETTEADIRDWGDGAVDLIVTFKSLFDENPDLQIEEVKSSAPGEHVRKFWAEHRKAYNAIKHADRDAKSLLDVALIDNEESILQAIVCSQGLNMKYTAEKHFFLCAMIALGKLPGGKDRPMELELILECLSKDEMMSLGRRNLCLQAYSDDADVLADCDVKVEELMKQISGKLANGVYKDIVFFNPG